MIEIKHLWKHFPGTQRPALSDINLKVTDGQFISLVGRSGSGKSTLLYIMSTLDKASEGEVLYQGESVRAMNQERILKLRNHQIGFVFQFHYLIQELTVLENVLLAARKAGEYQKRKPLAIQLLKDMGLEGMEQRFPSEISGGEQQRVAIARALIMEPTYLFADEPTGNLDSINGLMIMQMFQKINQERGTTIIYVTHDREFAAMAQRHITLTDGHLSESFEKV